MVVLAPRGSKGGERRRCVIFVKCVRHVSTGEVIHNRLKFRGGTGQHGMRCRGSYLKTFPSGMPICRGAQQRELRSTAVQGLQIPPAKDTSEAHISLVDGSHSKMGPSFNMID